MPSITAYFHRLNERHALTLSAVVLGVTVVLWIVAEWSRTPNEPIASTIPYVPVTVEPSTSPWSNIAPLTPTNNPFVSPVLRALLTTPPPPEDPPETHFPTVQNAEPAPSIKPLESAESTMTDPPPARVWTLIYRGIMQRPDGTRLALLSSGKKDDDRFLRVGDVYEDVFKVVSIESDAVTLLFKKRSIRLTTGQKEEITTP